MKRISAIVWALSILILASAQIYQIPIKDASSLVRVGMNPHPTDNNDTILAYALLSAIDRMDLDSLMYVRDAYTEKALNDSLKEKSWGSLAYILDRLINEVTGQTKISENLLNEDLYRYFTDNELYHLKNYLVIKYELNNYRPRSVKEHINTRTFYDDFLMFNDPYRSNWDMTDEIMRLLPVKKNDRVVDVGCGFGYNSYRLLNLVGDKGIVYATDTEEAYIEHLQALATNNNLSNLKPICTKSNELGVDDQVDCIIMSSLYHIIYTWSREDERSDLLTSIKKQLKDQGYFVIIDNENLHGDELNNCHVNANLIQAQLGFWGFEPVSVNRLSQQRYMLVLKRNDQYVPNVTVTSCQENPVLSITDQRSVVHIGSLDSYDITDRGIDAATYVYDFMGGGDRSLGEIAVKKYTELIPAENFGGEYSALQWLCEVKLADESKRNEMLQDPLSRSFYHKMTDDSCSVVRYYLLHKYKLGNDSIRMLSDSILELSGEVGRTHRSYLEDYILALNPKRPLWEHTDDIISHLGIREGDIVADIGCGSGFFTYRFSKLAGNTGKVYALELKDEHLQTLNNFLESENIKNVTTIKGQEEYVELPEQVDKIFMCSLYHIFYGVISDRDRDAYLKSLVKCLKPNGELIIVDNGPVDDKTLPYHGPYISKKLIEYQLCFYGFELVDDVQIIPQRYMLKFKLKKN